MHARVATWEGGDPDQVRQMVEGIKERSESGPPEGGMGERTSVEMYEVAVKIDS